MHKLLILGSTGFIGQHVMKYAPYISDLGYSISTWQRGIDGSLLDKSAMRKILGTYSPTHILHLAWGGLGINVDYDSDSHSHWERFTAELIHTSIQNGIQLWNVGTGSTKQLLKNLTLDNTYDFLKWLSIPYVFSVAHSRPRIVNDFLTSQGDFLLQNPRTSIDYVEVRDCAKQIVAIIENDDGKREFKVTSGGLIPNQDFIEKLKNVPHDQELVSCDCTSHEYPDLSDNLYFTRRFFDL